MPMVVPSGAAFATTSVPRLPLAPGRLSITNDCFDFACSRSPISRMMMSGVAAGRERYDDPDRLGGPFLRRGGQCAGQDRKQCDMQRLHRGRSTITCTSYSQDNSRAGQAAMTGTDAIC